MGGNQSNEEAGDVVRNLDDDLHPPLRHSRIAKSQSDNLIYTDRDWNRQRPSAVLYLFARTSREKEHWFHRLRMAACHETYRRIHPTLGNQPKTPPTPERKRKEKAQGEEADETESRSSSRVSLEELTLRVDQAKPVEDEDPAAREWLLYASLRKQFNEYMSTYVGPYASSTGGECCMDLGIMRWETPPLKDTFSEASHIAWANAIAARIFYDFSRNQDWIDKVKERIQRKLAAIHLPYFIEKLTLVKLEPGTVAPRIIGVHSPFCNDWGLWVDLDIEYPGGIQLVIETKVNLMKLKATSAQEMAAEKQETGEDSLEVLERQRAGSSAREEREWDGSRLCREDEPESPESSADEDPIPSQLSLRLHRTDSKPGTPQPPKEKPARKILDFIDKVVHTETFQTATDNKYVRKVMQGISETPLVLMVEVEWVSGVLALNIAPPPSDRLWYAFRHEPQLKLRALPKVGSKVVGVDRVGDWISNRLVQLVHKNLLIPNMDDVIVPLMSGEPLLTSYNL